MKLGRKAPKFVVDISKLEELKHLEAGEKIRIGAGRRYMDVLPFLQGLGRYHSLAEAIDSIGKLQVLSVATVGGNLGNGSPAADTPPPLITYDARVRVRSAHQERVVPLREFHTGPGKTVLAPNEIIVDVEFDAFPDGRASAFRKLTRVASDISKVTCAVTLQRDGETCTAVSHRARRRGADADAGAHRRGRARGAEGRRAPSWTSASAWSSRTSPPSTTSGAPRCTAGRRPACSSRTPSRPHGSVRHADQLHQRHRLHGQRRRAHARRRAQRTAHQRPPQRAGPDRVQVRLRHRPVRRLHGPRRR